MSGLAISGLRIRMRLRGRLLRTCPIADTGTELVGDGPAVRDQPADPCGHKCHDDNVTSLRLTLFAALSVALSLALWSLQPSAADGIPGARGLLFWALHVVVLLPLLYGAQVIVLWLPFQKWLVPVLSLVLSGVLGSLMFTPFAMAIDRLFAATNDVADNGPLLIRATGEFLNFAVPVTLIWILINTRQLSRLSVPRLNTDAQQDVPVLSPDETEFWSQVPLALGHDLVALSAEQHYVRVYTVKGDTLILFAFRRAVSAVARFEGMQIHRSHWVRLARVMDVTGTTRDLRCRLSNGGILPVSRANAATLRERVDQRRMSVIATTREDGPDSSATARS